MTHPPHWDEEIRVLKTKVAEMVAKGKVPPAGIVGVGVDDTTKRDYFVPRLQTILDDTRWPITFRVITVEDGMRTTDVKAKP